ncbi:MAG: RusA family crossover junction endodeoxyribonuclease [Prevotella sp.]|nr:RusA family crossover junction endodeoxyribonuclease [Prevotella sp.]MBR2096625.1 RusA family crossover junction endodeoxyribonuclease [Prevotella sp.]
MIRFTIPIDPPTVTFQDKCLGIRYGKPYMYESPKLKDAKAMIRAHVGKYKPAEPMKGPIKLSVYWVFRYTKASKEQWMVRKPDLDNLNKMLQDVMQDLQFFEDDSQIVILQAAKTRFKNPCISVELMELKDI